MLAELEYYVYYFYYTFIGYPFVIRFAVSFISIFLVFYLIAMLVLISSKLKAHRKKAIYTKIEKQYAVTIKEILASKDEYALKDIERIINSKARKHNDKEKRVLTNYILNLHNKEKSINEFNYNKLIDCFELRQFWEKKLKSGRLAEKQRALRKLDDFDIEIQGSTIAPLTYNRNQYVRKKARSSYLFFSKTSPFKFFNENFDKTFNEWDKIEIHRMFCRRSKDKLPMLSQWLKTSENPEFLCFLIDEIKNFRQDESCSYLTELINSPDQKVRKHCIEALGELGCEKAEEYIIKDYLLQPLTVQKTIINAVRKINTGNALPFLEEAYHNAHDHDHKMDIVKALYSYGESGRELLNSLKEKTNGSAQLIFDHVSNPLITY